MGNYAMESTWYEQRITELVDKIESLQTEVQACRKTIAEMQEYCEATAEVTDENTFALINENYQLYLTRERR